MLGIKKRKYRNKENFKVKVFLPVYINKTKLLDINSILFNGYSEFREETLETEKQNKNNTKVNMDTGIGFSIYKLNGSIEAEESYTDNNKRKIYLKKIQTNSSLLSNTINILKNNNLLKDRQSDNLSVGDFVQIKGTFKNNSICDILDQINELMSFGELVSSFSNTKNSNNDIKETKQSITKIKSAIKKRDANERELVYKTDDVIYVIHLLCDNIYNSTLDNIYNNDLCYFCQVKQIVDDNYNFFSDTQLSKFDITTLKDFIKSIEDIQNNTTYKFDFDLTTSSENKKTIELDVIAIYRMSDCI